jgi:hypothetical protein
LWPVLFHGFDFAPGKIIIQAFSLRAKMQTRIEFVKIRAVPKAPEDWRTPRRFANNEHHQMARSVLDCGSPLPLFMAAYQLFQC